MPKPSFLKNSIDTVYPVYTVYTVYNWWEDKVVYIFLKGISPKDNVKTQLESELTYFEAAVQHISRYTPKIPRIKYRYFRR